MLADFYKLIDIRILHCDSWSGGEVEIGGMQDLP